MQEQEQPPISMLPERARAWTHSGGACLTGCRENVGGNLKMDDMWRHRRAPQPALPPRRVPGAGPGAPAPDGARVAPHQEHHHQVQVQVQRGGQRVVPAAGAGAAEAPLGSAMHRLGLTDEHAVWSLQENARLFLECIRTFFGDAQAGTAALHPSHVPLCHRVTVSLCHAAPVSLCHCATAPLCHCSAPPQCPVQGTGTVSEVLGLPCPFKHSKAPSTRSLTLRLLHLCHCTVTRAGHRVPYLRQGRRPGGAVRGVGLQHPGALLRHTDAEPVCSQGHRGKHHSRGGKPPTPSWGGLRHCRPSRSCAGRGRTPRTCPAYSTGRLCQPHPRTSSAFILPSAVLVLLLDI